jgi:hypothetical protein
MISISFRRDTTEYLARMLLVELSIDSFTSVPLMVIRTNY